MLPNLLYGDVQTDFRGRMWSSWMMESPSVAYQRESGHPLKSKGSLGAHTIRYYSSIAFSISEKPDGRYRNITAWELKRLKQRYRERRDELSLFYFQTRWRTKYWPFFSFSAATVKMISLCSRFYWYVHIRTHVQYVCVHIGSFDDVCKHDFSYTTLVWASSFTLDARILASGLKGLQSSEAQKSWACERETAWEFSKTHAASVSQVRSVAGDARTHADKGFSIVDARQSTHQYVVPLTGKPKGLTHTQVISTLNGLMAYPSGVLKVTVGHDWHFSEIWKAVPPEVRDSYVVELGRPWKGCQEVYALQDFDRESLVSVSRRHQPNRASVEGPALFFYSAIFWMALMAARAGFDECTELPWSRPLISSPTKGPLSSWEPNLLCLKRLLCARHLSLPQQERELTMESSAYAHTYYVLYIILCSAVVTSCYYLSLSSSTTRSATSNISKSDRQPHVFTEATEPEIVHVKGYKERHGDLTLSGCGGWGGFDDPWCFDRSVWSESAGVSQVFVLGRAQG